MIDAMFDEMFFEYRSNNDEWEDSATEGSNDGRHQEEANDEEERNEEARGKEARSQEDAQAR